MAELPRQRRTIPAWPVVLLALALAFARGRAYGWEDGYYTGVGRGIDSYHRVSQGLPL